MAINDKIVRTDAQNSELVRLMAEQAKDLAQTANATAIILTNLLHGSLPHRGSLCDLVNILAEYVNTPQYYDFLSEEINGIEARDILSLYLANMSYSGRDLLIEVLDSETSEYRDLLDKVCESVDELAFEKALERLFDIVNETFDVDIELTDDM